MYRFYEYVKCEENAREHTIDTRDCLEIARKQFRHDGKRGDLERLSTSWRSVNDYRHTNKGY